MPQRLSDVPLSHLVPDSRDWNNGAGVDLETWAGCMGSIELAIAFGELFWPPFFEFDGCVFRGEGPTPEFERSYARALKSSHDDRTAVEGLFNHHHIWDIFPSKAGDPQPTRDQCLYLARLLRETWQAALKRTFPDRRFEVTVNETGPAAEEGDFQVVFFQQHREVT